MRNKQYIFLFVSLISIIQALFVVKFEVVSYIEAGCIYILLYCLMLFINKLKYNLSSNTVILINSYLFINIMAIVRSFLYNNLTYWDFKQIFFLTGPTLLLPTVIYLGQNIFATKLFYKNFIIYSLPFSLLVFIELKFTENTDGLTRYLSPIYFLIFFIPYIKFKWKVLIFGIAFFSIISDLGTRSNIIRIFVSLVMMSSIYFNKIISKRLLKIFHYLVFIIPFFLFLLASLNMFNIFNTSDYIKGDYTFKTKTQSGQSIENDLVSDTRTFLYIEVVESVVKRNNIIWGESAIGGYETSYFDSKGSLGRYGSEVGILNIFLYTGIIGVVFYSLLFFYASYLSIYKSNNFLIKVIGLYISFRWAYSWIEEFTNFDMNYFVLWLMIGFCLSEKCRKMSDSQMRTWVCGIFGDIELVIDSKNKSFKTIAK